MHITHALVAKGTFVLCEFSALVDNLLDVSRKVLGKVPRARGRRTYVYESKTFNYLVDNELIYMCVGSAEAGSEVPFQFLDDLREKFRREYERPAMGGASKSAELTRMVKSLMDDYNQNFGLNRIHKVERELDDVTDIMKDNIQRVMERGEQIESLMGKTELLKGESVRFRMAGRAMKRSLWWQSFKSYLFILLIVTCICFVLGSLSCGGLTFSRCRAFSIFSSSSSSLSGEPQGGSTVKEKKR
mmetsp:Transcript_31655/g.91698  ORF Transcript_31655/g.91698 Transcript_31655/m.91698 type:complete len:244 (+) Transcript_31655:53-784(+)